MRTLSLSRATRETEISLNLNLDGSRNIQVDTGIGFFDHMLTAFAFHAGFDFVLSAKGDLQVDCHHTVEDVGILLGKALGQLFAEKSGLCRYGSAYVPMDESLGFAALDISGRPFLVFDCSFQNERVGAFDCCMAKEWFRAVAFQSGLTLHVRCLYGENDHHKLEALFKAFGQALHQGSRITGEKGVLSTKGILE